MENKDYWHQLVDFTYKEDGSCLGKCKCCGKELVYISINENGKKAWNTSTFTKHFGENGHNIHNFFNGKVLMISNNSISNGQTKLNFTKQSSDQQLKNIATYFATKSIPRDHYDCPQFKKAFSNDRPKGTDRSDLDSSIETISNEIFTEIKQKLTGTPSHLEIDGAKKAGKDYSTILLNGDFINTYLFNKTETKENLVKDLKERIEKLEIEYKTVVVCATNDNCIRIDAPMHSVCHILGIFHTSKPSYLIQDVPLILLI